MVYYILDTMIRLVKDIPAYRWNLIEMNTLDTMDPKQHLTVIILFNKNIRRFLREIKPNQVTLGNGCIESVSSKKKGRATTIKCILMKAKISSFFRAS